MSVNCEDLLKLINISYGKQREYLADLTEEEKSAASDISDWSPKDVMAHIIYWNADMAGELAGLEHEDIGDGGLGVDHINADVWQQYKDVTWPEVEDLVLQVQRDLIESLKDVDEEQLNDSQRYEWTNGRPLWQRINFRCFYHPLQHIAELVVKRGEVERANDIQEEMTRLQLALVDSDTWRGNVFYNLGCHYAATGQREKALDNIGRGIRLYPYLKEWAPQDGDLESLRDDPGLMALLE
jgi:hypothetical protein